MPEVVVAHDRRLHEAEGQELEAEREIRRRPCPEPSTQTRGQKNHCSGSLPRVVELGGQYRGREGDGVAQKGKRGRDEQHASQAGAVACAEHVESEQAGGCTRRRPPEDWHRGQVRRSDREYGAKEAAEGQGPSPERPRRPVHQAQT